MPNLTRSSLVTRLGELISDPNNTEWTASQKQNKIDEYQEKFVIETRCLTDIASTSVVAGTAEYALPTDIIDVNRVALDGLELQRISKLDLDFYTNQDWTTETGTPAYYYIDLDPDNTKIGLVPFPTASGSSNLKVEYIKQPTALSSDSSVPFNSHTLLYPYHMALVYGPAYEFLVAVPTPENIQKANAVRRLYEDMVEKCINYFRSMTHTSPLRLKGGRYYKGL